MGPKKENKRLDILESDTDSDYNPKVTVSKRKKQSKGTESPVLSDTDGKRKRKRQPTTVEENEDSADEQSKKSKNDGQEQELASYSEEICALHKLVNVDVSIPDDMLSGINYKQFNKIVRHKVIEANPKVSGLHVTSLVGAKWREFKELYGMDSETPDLERVKSTTVYSPMSSSDQDTKDSMPESPDESVNADSGGASEEDDEEYGSYLKLKFTRKGNKIFRSGDRKTSRQSKKTARQGIVNLDEINLEEVSRTEPEETEPKKKSGPKKRTGPRIKTTKDKKEKKKAKEAAAALRAAGAKRGPIKKGKKDEPVLEPVHNSVCDVCAEGGDILLCDTCTCSWHLTCLDPPLDEVPEGNWSCPKCELEISGRVQEEEEEETFHGEYCKICKDGGELLCCDFCPGTYHMRCVKPQLITVPEGEWKCPMCLVDTLPEKVERILFWKFLTHKPTDAEIKSGAKDEPYKVRKFFVKFLNMSYWKCHWISELQLEKYHVSLYRFFCRKNDMNDPPMTEEGILEEGDDVNVDENEHNRNMDQRFYQYGIKPEWLQINRVVWSRYITKGKHVTKDIEYLVKWKEIGYDQATWEQLDDPDNKDVTDFDKAIENYESIKARYNKKLKQKDKGTKSRKKEGWENDVRPNGYTFEEQPSFITDSGGKLHDYQVAGINWIRYSWAHRENTILADEMGLGKTIQTIAFLYSLWKEGRSEGPFLICAPLSTIVNWEREFEFWAPEMYVVTYCGNRENRQVIRNYEMTFDESVKKGNKAYKMKNIQVKFHVLLTSYELVAIDANTLQSIDWRVLVIDEAHRLKNNQSRFFRTMSLYSIDYTLLLTGTPLQNNLEELFHLLNFLCPQKFVNREMFLAEFEDIGKEDQIKKLHEMLGPHMLRRLKADVLKGMPTKSEFIVRIELSPMQKKYYKFILTKNFGALNTRGSAQVSLLNIVMELKKCCNHPYLFATAALEAPRLGNNAYEVRGLTEASGKLVLLHKMMVKLKAQGHRVLIFSQMTRVLDLLEDFMEGHCWRYERLDGTITGSVRQAAIDRFNLPNSDIFGFLLSTRAGGLGINLATADTVFIFDSDWNPHNDIQAFSRAHRIGQQNKVMIYRFVTKGTVEERITQVAKKKMMLTHLVVRPGLGSKAAQAMSKRELDDILKFGTEQMFKESEEELEGVRIHYDDKAIESLLDRSNEGIIEKESGMDDYLSSFKVASYTVKNKDEPDVEVLKQEADAIDADYWENLLRHHYEQEQEYVASTLGKGKRVRKQVNYSDGSMITESNKNFRGTYEDGSDFDASELVDDSEDLSDEEGSNNLTSRQKKYKERDILPPLLAKVGNQIEVYGFNPRQRRAFLTAVMRYGLPPKEFQTAKDKWCIHNLRGKTEKAFQAYTSMFLRHLCEPTLESKETYSDGVPREGINRLQALSRIGIMSLIKRKIEEYSGINAFLHDVLTGHIAIQDRSLARLVDEIKNARNLGDNSKISTPTASKVDTKNQKTTNETNICTVNENEDTSKKDVGAYDKDDSESNDKEDNELNQEEDVNSKSEHVEMNKEEDMEVDKLESDKSTGVAKEVDSEKAKEVDSEKAKEIKLTTSDKPVEEIKPSEQPLESKSESSSNVDVEMITDTSTASVSEEAKPSTTAVSGEPKPAADKPSSENDAKTEVIDILPIENSKEASAETKPEAIKDTTTNTENVKNREISEKVEVVKTSGPLVIEGVTLPKFMFNIADGGFTELHVLWEAEEKRRFDNIWWRYHDYWLLSGIIVHGYGRWQDIQNDPRFETINRPFTRMSVDYKNKFIARRFKLLEQALIVEEQLKRSTLMGVQQDNQHPAMSLQSRFAELECLAESHQHLSKESLSGNKPANAVLHKVLNQLETLLSDMKNDVTRLPTALAKMPPVTHRLAMSERAVLTRLTQGGQKTVIAPVLVGSAGVQKHVVSPLLPVGADVAKPPLVGDSNPPAANQVKMVYLQPVPGVSSPTGTNHTAPIV